MKHTLIKGFLLLTIVFWTGFVFGQDFAKDLSGINYAYFDLNRTITLTSKVYSGSTLQESKSVKIAMAEIDKYYMNGEGTEMLVRDGKKLVVNHSSKIIVLDTNQKDSKSHLPVWMFDTIAQVYKSITHKKISSTTHQYSLVPKIDRIKNIIIQYDPMTMLLKQVTIYSVDPSIKKEYKVTNSYAYSQLTASSIPKLSNYMSTDRAGRNKTSQKYQNYEFIDYTAQ